MTRPVHLVAFTIIGVLFTVFGFLGEGYLYQASILFGGMYLGNVITDALNYNETKEDKDE